MTPVLDEIVARAKVLRDEGLSWDATAHALGLSSWASIRRRLDPKYREREKRRQAKPKAAQRYKAKLRRISAEAFDQAYLREARTSSPPVRMRKVIVARGADPQETLAGLLGDPPPGRSALDRRAECNQ